MQRVLNEILENNKKWTEIGKVASYIPELAKINPKIIGIFINDLKGKEYFCGNYETKFTLQSISKVFSLICALIDKGENKVFSKVGYEPTVDMFNSIVKLETIQSHKPLNPFINAGAIVTISLVNGDNSMEKYQRILSLIKKMSNNDCINVNYNIYSSEKFTGNTNRAIAYYLKGANIIEKDVEDILDTYFKLCSLDVTVKDVANMASVIANNGVAPWSGEIIIPKEVNKIINALMMTCGLYNVSGQSAVKIGLPAKSGVGGGIMAIAPEKMGIGIVAPALDEKGNSIAGMKVLEELSQRLNLSIF